MAAGLTVPLFSQGRNAKHQAGALAPCFVHGKPGKAPGAPRRGKAATAAGPSTVLAALA